MKVDGCRVVITGGASGIGTTAIQMANQGRSLDEISASTGLSSEEIEPILKYHGKN